MILRLTPCLKFSYFVGGGLVIYRAGPLKFLLDKNDFPVTSFSGFHFLFLSEGSGVPPFGGRQLPLADSSPWPLTLSKGGD
jgi:hypothetical protein